ncbi:MAG: tetratricopeptide repeat protein [Planctomycetaceae bacterium]|nr:tetratricopeptide repeat protein [Planctomycetaceae bacterium]
MVRETSKQSWVEIDEFVEVYDRAWRTGTVPVLGEFLPERDHPMYSEVLCELVRVDLELRWRQGCPLSLDDYCRAYPELGDDPQALAEVAFEEYRVRRHAGAEVTPGDYADKYQMATSGWPVLPAGGLSGKQSLPLPELGTAAGDADIYDSSSQTFPDPGSELFGFQLLSELGRGAFSRVYLARQADLANRLVVLKLSTESLAEADKLAQLQHANIVPIYSIHQSGACSAVCMPYCGATTLADVIRDCRLAGSLPESGRRLVETIATRDASTRRPRGHTRDGSRSISTPQPTGSVSRLDEAPAPDAANSLTGLRTLAGLNYVEAILWIGACLADGLQHAHARGIVHRDLKPANILLADDGQPMLLDFNLSEDTKLRDAVPAAVIGGTLPYMAPEQIVAFRDCRSGGDVRSDLFSLGVILYELLTGRLPYPAIGGASDEMLTETLKHRQQSPPRLRHINPAVSPAVESLVQHCLAPDVRQRYQTADQLLEDLRCQLEHRPLRYTPEPSLCERSVKWIKRHPRLMWASSIALVTMVLLGTWIAIYQVDGERLARLEAVETLQHFQADLRSAQVLCLDVSSSGQVKLAAVKAACRRALDRFQILKYPHWQGAGAVRHLPPDSQTQLSSDASELLFLLASLSLRDASFPSSAVEHSRSIEEALDFNSRAAACSADSRQSVAVKYQRGLLLQARGGAVAEAQQLLDTALSATPLTIRDECMLACLYMARRQLSTALPLWKHATEQDPRNSWTWYGLGNCYMRLSCPTDAVSCFTACIALQPDASDWYFHRGVALLEMQDFAQAERDFSNVLRQEPDNLDALVNRGLAELGAADFRGAVADLTTAIARGKDESRVYLMLAQAKEKSGDVLGARKDRQAAIARQPTDAEGWVAYGVTQVGIAPTEALVSFDRALAVNPQCLPALESKAHVLAEKLRQTAAAIQVLDRAVELYPEHAPVIAARGVLHARQGQRDAAVRDAEQALHRDQSGEIQFQVAGIYSLTSKAAPTDRDRALNLLASALRQGFGAQLIESDPDLDPLRNDPQFKQLVRAAQTLTVVSP